MITLAFMLMFAKPLPICEFERHVEPVPGFAEIDTYWAKVNEPCRDSAAKATYAASFSTVMGSFWDPDVDTWSLLLKPGTMEATGCSHLTGTVLHPVETKWPVAVCKLHQVWWDLTR